MAQDSPKSPSTAEDEEFLPDYPSVVSYTQDCYGKLVKTTQKAHGLPNPGDDFEFYSSFPDFRDFCKSQGNRMLSNIKKLMNFRHVKCGWPKDLDDDKSLETDDLFDSLVEANDILLEQIDSCLDEASGLSKNKKPVLPPSMQQGSPVVSSWNRSNHSTNCSMDEKLRFLHAKNILRPQLKFKEKPDNSNVPFIPIIKEKPNALKPLEEHRTYETEIPEEQDVPAALANFIHEQRLHTPGGENLQSNLHPYQFELEQFEPENDDMNLKESQVYNPLDETNLVFVDNVEKLSQLLTVLKDVKEFAVDLEHHSFRSFQGFVCLMQISTREEDYLVDTVELRSELPVLNEVFTDPGILKVMHGADMDIGWLQRDFGIYVVNMFDTGQATRVLEYPRFSLAYLLKKFCDVTADKQYQLADWRIRPLPSEMVRYAREDTHYLLYVYDRLRNELVSKGNENNNLIQSVYKRSKDICLRTYEKPIFTSGSYLALYHKHKKSFNRNQLEAFRLLYAWRDEIARLEDESYGYVLPNHMLFCIAEVLPKEPQGVLACCNPVPTLVRQNINEIHRLVVQAREFDPKLNGPTTPAQSSVRGNRQPSDTVANMDVNEATASGANGGDDLNAKGEPMTAFKDLRIIGTPVLIAEPTIRLFGFHEQAKDLTEGEKKANDIRESLKNPYQAFLRARKPEEASSHKSSKEINQQWKVKSEEAKRDQVNDGVTRESEDETKKRKHDSSSEREDDVAEEPVALRQAKKKKTKKEKDSKESKISQLSAEQGKISKENEQFVPYDYSSVGLNFGDKNNEGAEKNKDTFNPYKKLTEKTKKFGSKVRMKSGERSMTFTQKM